MVRLHLTPETGASHCLARSDFKPRGRSKQSCFDRMTHHQAYLLTEKLLSSLIHEGASLWIRRTSFFRYSFLKYRLNRPLRIALEKEAMRPPQSDCPNRELYQSWLLTVKMRNSNLHYSYLWFPPYIIDHSKFPRTLSHNVSMDHNANTVSNSYDHHICPSLGLFTSTSDKMTDPIFINVIATYMLPSD